MKDFEELKKELDEWIKQKEKEVLAKRRKRKPKPQK